MTLRPSKIRIISLTLVLMFLIGTFPVLAQTAAPTLPEGVQRITSVEGITEYALPNGLHILLFPDAVKPTITVNLTYLVGSRNEGYGETGMAHLLEHMLFKGTPKNPNIPQEISSHGANANATTWLDRTNFFETFAATDENLRWALELEADRMINSNVAKKDLDSEMTVVRNEFERGENSAARVLQERALSTAYLWHNYGKSTIGARADIENVPIERLQAFYHNYYQPDNAVLLLAGKFDEAKTLRMIKDIFGAIPRPTRKLQKTYTVEPVQDGERTVTLRRVGDVQYVGALYHIPSGSHPDFAAIDMLSDLLSEIPSGKLYKNLVETKKATSASGYAMALREPGFLYFSAEVPKDGSIDAARDALLDTIENFAKTPPSKEEVERIRQRSLKGIEQMLNSSEVVGMTLSESIAQGDWRLFFLNRDRIGKVTPEDIQRVAATYLLPTNRTVALFAPTDKPLRAEIPPVPDVAAMLKDYKGDAAVAAGEAFDPSPVNIEARTKRLTTAGGLKLAMLPKKTRGETVVAQLNLNFGDETSLQNRTTAARFVGSLLRSGTLKHNRQQLQDELDRLKAQVSVWSSASNATVSLQTTRHNLPEVLYLIAEILRQPAFPADEFEQSKRQNLSGLEQGRSDPQAIAGRLFNRHLNPYPQGDVRYIPTLDEDIAATKAVTLDDVKKFYADFYGASNGEMGIVGDFDEKETAELISKFFDDWKSPKPYHRIERTYKEVPVLNQALETPDKANAIFLAGLNLNLRQDDEDYPALVLANYMLGGGFLNSRLATRIRQKEGLSYSVGSGISASALDKTGLFTASAIYAPENAAKLETAFKEEIARVLQDGFTPEEIAAAKSGYLQSRGLSRAQDFALAGALASYLQLGRTFQWDNKFEQRISDLTPADINQALRRFIKPENITIVKAGDFNKVRTGS